MGALHACTLPLLSPHAEAMHLFPYFPARCPVLPHQVVQQPAGTYTAQQHSARVAPLFLEPVLAYAVYWAVLGALQLFDRRDRRRLDSLNRKLRKMVSELKVLPRDCISKTLLCREHLHALLHPLWALSACQPCFLRNMEVGSNKLWVVGYMCGSVPLWPGLTRMPWRVGAGLHALRADAEPAGQVRPGLRAAHAAQGLAAAPPAAQRACFACTGPAGALVHSGLTQPSPVHVLL